MSTTTTLPSRGEGWIDRLYCGGLRGCGPPTDRDGSFVPRDLNRGRPWSLGPCLTVDGVVGGVGSCTRSVPESGDRWGSGVPGDGRGQDVPVLPSWSVPPRPPSLILSPSVDLSASDSHGRSYGERRLSKTHPRIEEGVLPPRDREIGVPERGENISYFFVLVADGAQRR